LFTTEASAHDNLRHEGILQEKIHFVGNVTIDTLLAHRDRARALRTPDALGLRDRAYAVLTLHRPTNVDAPHVFERVMESMTPVAGDVPIVFPVHPRTRSRVAASPAAARLVAQARLRLLDPLGYLEFIGLMDGSRLVLTDSGGIQEETTVLGVPCLTLRDNTERPVTVTHGTNSVVGTNPEKIAAAWARIKSGHLTSAQPPLWDGSSARRIVGVLETLASRRQDAST
jgi:UDP-N-acetylglucosamine 2-epimerase (non-hydrolysing)